MVTLDSDIARRAAARLTDLNPLLERAARTGEREAEPAGPARRMRGIDPGTGIAVAGLLVSLAQVGWQIYRDLRSDRADREKKEQAVAALVSRLRPSLTGPAELTPDQRDRILRVLAEEIVASQPTE